MYEKVKKRKNRKNRGFTLVELVIVVAVLAILVGLLAPQYTKYVEKSRKSADADNMKELVKAIEVFVVDGGVLPQSAEGEPCTIQINGSGTNGTSKTTVVRGTAELLKSMDEEMPGWQNLKTKSKKWGDNGKVSSIYADIKIGKDGEILSVTYRPAKFAAYMGNGK